MDIALRCRVVVRSVFLAFEKGKSGTKEMILIAVMVALSAVGRLVLRGHPA